MGVVRLHSLESYVRVITSEVIVSADRIVSMSVAPEIEKAGRTMVVHHQRERSNWSDSSQFCAYARYVSATHSTPPSSPYSRWPAWLRHRCVLRRWSSLQRGGWSSLAVGNVVPLLQWKPGVLEHLLYRAMSRRPSQLTTVRVDHRAGVRNCRTSSMTRRSSRLQWSLRPPRF